MQTLTMTTDGFSDASFANATKGRSMLSWAIFANGGLIDYHVGISPVVTLSTTHAEGISMSNMTKQILSHSMMERQFGHDSARFLHTDNRGQLYIALGSSPKKSSHQHWRIRHIQAVVRAGVCQCRHIATKMNVADIGSKLLRSKDDFERLRAIFLTTG